MCRRNKIDEDTKRARCTIERLTRQWLRAKLHYTDTGYEHQLYEHHQRTKICHILTPWRVEMLGSGIAMWQICCRIVVSLSFGGVRSRCS